MAPRIVLNGTPIATGASVETIAGLLSERAINPAHVVVEINREIVDLARFETFELRDGDVVEILRFVGGG